MDAWSLDYDNYVMCLASLLCDDAVQNRCHSSYLGSGYHVLSVPS